MSCKFSFGRRFPYDFCQSEAHPPLGTAQSESPHLHVSLPSPALRTVGETWEKTANKKYVKLCTDGVYKATRDDYVVLTLGILVKDWSRDVRSRQEACTTSFRELVVGIAKSECEKTYSRMFAALQDIRRDAKSHKATERQ